MLNQGGVEALNTVPSESNGRHLLNDNLLSHSPVSLTAFLTEVCASFQERCEALNVVCGIDASPEIPSPAGTQVLTKVLKLMIEDALSAMPDGGQLDLVGVANANGYEIEISDSGDRHWDLPSEAPSELWSHGQHLALAAGMELDAARCPQSGIARTLLIPQQAARAAA